MKHQTTIEKYESQIFCNDFITNFDIDNFISRINGSLNLERLIDDCFKFD